MTIEHPSTLTTIDDRKMAKKGSKPLPWATTHKMENWAENRKIAKIAPEAPVAKISVFEFRAGGNSGISEIPIFVPKLCPGGGSQK